MKANGEAMTKGTLDIDTVATPANTTMATPVTMAAPMQVQETVVMLEGSHQSRKRRRPWRCRRPSTTIGLVMCRWTGRGYRDRGRSGRGS